MPPLPTIANTFRVTLDWTTQHGIRPVNVFHVHSASSDVLAIGADIQNAMVVPSPLALFKCMQSDFTIPSFSILPLDGSTATVTIAASGQGGGGGSGQLVPAAAGVVSFHTAQRGARGRGRMYVGPCTETVISDGALDTTVQTQMLSAWGDFLTALPTGTEGVTMVVASYVHADQHAITNIRVDTLIGTQRRRQDQLR